MQFNWKTIVPILAALTPFLLAALAGTGWLYRHEKERREAVERQLSEHKYKAYITLIDIFFDLVKAIKKGKDIDQKDLIDRTLDATKNLIIYGSDEVVSSYFKFLASAPSGKDYLKQFTETMVVIRKDMGNSKTKISSEDILRILIADYDEAKAKKISG